MSLSEHTEPATPLPAPLVPTALDRSAATSEPLVVFVEVEVSLMDADGEVVATTVSDRDGHYWFTGLEPEGQYSVVVTGPTGFESRAVDFTAPAFVPGVTTNRAGAALADDPTLHVALRPETPKVSPKKSRPSTPAQAEPPG